MGIIEWKRLFGVRVSRNYGYHFGGPCNKDYSILGSILGFPLFRETTKSVHPAS